MKIPLEETPEETRQRLERLARLELDQAMEAGGIEAAALDGSLGSGRLWPSSDLDMTAVPTSGRNWSVEWLIRDGIIVHKHINRWPLLEKLRDGYPQSFIDTAAGDWVRDPTWLLDGLAALRPVHDPTGRLEAFREFIRNHRFCPEVIEPRRPLLLTRARSLKEAAARAFGAGDPMEGAWQLELAIEAAALIWLEAAGRIISLKEMDAELAASCDQLGDPSAHGLFRTAAGVNGLQSRLPEITAAFRELLQAYSDWLDAILEGYPCGDPELDRWPCRFVYHRHRYWSGLYAPGRGCYLHLASVRLTVEREQAADLESFTRKWAIAGARSSEREYSASAPSPADALLDPLTAINQARTRLLDAFPLPPCQERLEAMEELIIRTERAFGAEAPAGGPYRE